MARRGAGNQKRINVQYHSRASVQDVQRASECIVRLPRAESGQVEYRYKFSEDFLFSIDIHCYHSNKYKDIKQ